jgi:hypothetical protein
MAAAAARHGGAVYNAGGLACRAVFWSATLFFSRAIRIELVRQAHLNDSSTLERLEALMPKVFGIT